MNYHLRRMAWGLVIFAVAFVVAISFGLLAIATAPYGIGVVVVVAGVVGTSYLIGGAVTGESR